MKMSKREHFSKWLDIITYGDKKKYVKFILWLFLDSFVASIPSSILMCAVYFFLAPVLDKTSAYEQMPFWNTLFQELGFETVFSDESSRQM